MLRCLDQHGGKPLHDVILEAVKEEAEKEREGEPEDETDTSSRQCELSLILPSSWFRGH